MKNIKLFLFLLTTLLGYKSTLATTWDEPWANQVIKEANSFVLAKVVKTDAKNGISIHIIKTLGGEELTGDILINGFYALSICSTSGGHGPEFKTIEVDECYFFIKKNKDGKFSIATPSTGYDYVIDGQVSATYRISIHQASVPVNVYELTMTAIFNNYHNKQYNKEPIILFIKENLSKKPAGFDKSEIDQFFLQHVAMECVYHLKLNTEVNLLVPFLSDRKNFHNQVSAARALRSNSSKESETALLEVISDTSRRDFVRVLCVWSLSELNPKSIKNQLQELQTKASDEADRFSLNIMDSRICTQIPSLKEALTKLIEKL